MNKNQILQQIKEWAASLYDASYNGPGYDSKENAAFTAQWISSEMVKFIEKLEGTKTTYPSLLNYANMFPEKDLTGMKVISINTGSEGEITKYEPEFYTGDANGKCYRTGERLDEEKTWVTIKWENGSPDSLNELWAFERVLVIWSKPE